MPTNVKPPTPEELCPLVRRLVERNLSTAEIVAAVTHEHPLVALDDIAQALRAVGAEMLAEADALERYRQARERS